MNESQKEKTSFVAKTWSALKRVGRWIARAATGAGKATGKATVWTAKKGLRLVIGVSLVVVSVIVTVAAVIVVALFSIGVTIGAQLGLFLWWVCTGMKQPYKDFSGEIVEAVAVYFQTYSDAMSDPEFVKFAEDAYETMTNLDPDDMPYREQVKYYVSAMDTPGDPDTIYAYGVFTSQDNAWDFHREMSRREKFVSHQEATIDLLGEEKDYDRWIFVHDGEYVSFERLGYQEAKSVDFSLTDDDAALKAYRNYEAKAMDAKDLDAVNYWRGRSYARTNPERALTPNGTKMCLAAIYAQTKDEYRKDAATQGIETEIEILNTRQPVPAGR